jgi:hypothetical protein
LKGNNVPINPCYKYWTVKRLINFGYCNKQITSTTTSIPGSTTTTTTIPVCKNKFEKCKSNIDCCKGLCSRTYGWCSL